MSPVPPAVEEVLDAALEAWRAPPAVQRRIMHRMLHVAEQLGCVDQTLATYVYSACKAVADSWPAGTTTLVPVGCQNPDDLVRGDTKGQGMLLASRVLVALSNGDTAFAVDLLNAPPRREGRVNVVLVHAAMYSGIMMRGFLRAEATR